MFLASHNFLVNYAFLRCSCYDFKSLEQKCFIQHMVSIKNEKLLSCSHNVGIWNRNNIHLGYVITEMLR